MPRKIEWFEEIQNLWTIRGLRSEICYITREGFGLYRVFLDDEPKLVFPSLRLAKDYAERNAQLNG